MNAGLDEGRYAILLSSALPKVIETEEENERLLTEVEGLTEKGVNRSPEEEQLLKLLIALIERFEDEHYPLEATSPQETLQELMEARGLKQSDLWELFGSKGIASEVINGKRSISKAQAKALGKFFHVSPVMFL